MATSLDASEANEKAKPDHLTVAELHLWLTTADFLKMREKFEKENVFDSQLFISILRRKVAHLQPYTELVTTSFSGIFRRKSIHNNASSDNSA